MSKKCEILDVSQGLLQNGYALLIAAVQLMKGHKKEEAIKD
jgi:hypothetical protein